MCDDDNDYDDADDIHELRDRSSLMPHHLDPEEHNDDEDDDDDSLPRAPIHSLRLPLVWRGHPYIHTTRQKTHRRHFADVHGIKRTLHACAEKPLRVLG
jgi:hypothetical protein